MTIACEGAEVCREHISQNRDMAPDNYVILNAALSQAMSDDYILSARLRTRVMRNLNDIFSKVWIYCLFALLMQLRRLMHSLHLQQVKLRNRSYPVMKREHGNFRPLSDVWCTSKLQIIGIGTFVYSRDALLVHEKDVIFENTTLKSRISRVYSVMALGIKNS